MVSYYGTFEFKNLVQAYDLYDKRRFPSEERPYHKDSIFSYVNDNKDFSLFAYLFKTAELDRRADEELFMATVFVCPDSFLIEKYGERFFMDLDRNTALAILNNHILTKPIGMKTLMGRRVAILDTRNKKSTISLVNNRGNITLNDNCQLISTDIHRSNGIIYVVDSLLLPEGFMLL